MNFRKGIECVFLCFSADCNIGRQQRKTESENESNINNKEKTSAVLCTEIRKSPNISDTDGLLCGISSADFMPCAFRCLVTLTPQPLDENLRKKLLFSSKEIQRWAKLNMLTVDNRNE